MKVSKVKTVDFVQSFEYNNETYYQHKYIMEDGTEINANHKSMNPIAVGADVEYEVTGNDKQGKPKGKVNKLKEGNFSGSGSPKKYVDNSDAILYQTCLKAISEQMATRGNSITEYTIEEVERMSTLALHLAKLSKSNIEHLKA
jgi:hypothetical protein